MLNEYQKFLNQFGYKVKDDNLTLTIVSKNISGVIVMVISFCSGIFLYPFIGGDPKGIILIILLVFYPISVFRIQSKRRIFIDYRNGIDIRYTKYLLFTKKMIKLTNIKIELNESENFSYASSFDDSNKEYIHRIELKSNELNLELFYFHSREKSVLKPSITISRILSNSLCSV